MNTKRFPFSACIIIAALILFRFAPAMSKPSSNDEGCGVWQYDQNSALEFRTCTDPQYPQFKSYQFFNGYNFQVHILCEMTFTDGTKSRSGMYVGPETKSDAGSTGGKTVAKWRFYEKLKKDDKGNWVNF